jgi:hypothetical protein
MFWRLTYGLGVWNIPANFIKNETFAPTMAIFNRCAGQKDHAASSGAIISLRDGLDSADFERFPASEYGDDRRVVGNGTFGNCPGGGSGAGGSGTVCCKNARQTAQEHYVADFAHRGARLEAPKEAAGKSLRSTTLAASSLLPITACS